MLGEYKLATDILSVFTFDTKNRYKIRICKKKEQFHFIEKINENYKLFVKYFKRYAYKRCKTVIFDKNKFY